jgi:hypothetical protein
MAARRPLRSLLAVTAAGLAVGLAVAGIVLASCAATPTHPDPDLSTADVLYLNEFGTPPSTSTPRPRRST